MDREEFLEILAAQLTGEIPSPEISQHLAYYNSFIDQKLRQGQTEAEILAGLGDPRLIAKTLIDTEDVPNVHGYQQTYAYSAEEAKPDGGFTQEGNSSDGPSGDFQQETAPTGGFHLDTSTWYVRLILAAGIIVLVLLLFFVLRALLPVVAVLVLVGMIFSWINRRR